jgi:hypothetical protein
MPWGIGLGGGSHNLPPLPAHLILILFDFDVCIDALAADEFQVGYASIGQDFLGAIEDLKVGTRVAVMRWIVAARFVPGLPETRLSKEHNAVIVQPMKHIGSQLLNLLI